MSEKTYINDPMGLMIAITIYNEWVVSRGTNMPLTSWFDLSREQQGRFMAVVAGELALEDLEGEEVVQPE